MAVELFDQTSSSVYVEPTAATETTNALHAGYNFLLHREIRFDDFKQNLHNKCEYVQSQTDALRTRRQMLKIPPVKPTTATIQ